MSWVGPVLATSLAWLAQAPAADKAPETYVIHHWGTTSCASAFADQGAERAFSLWVMGYFSGRNVSGASHDVGSSSDQAGITGEVKLYCRDHPSAQLMDAVSTIYDDLRDARR